MYLKMSIRLLSLLTIILWYFLLVNIFIQSQRTVRVIKTLENRIHEKSLEELELFSPEKKVYVVIQWDLIIQYQFIQTRA